VLTEQRDKLSAVTARLLEVEVMEGEELRRILDAPSVPADAVLPPVN
jgi:hypothetical protein